MGNYGKPQIRKKIKNKFCVFFQFSEFSQNIGHHLEIKNYIICIFKTYISELNSIRFKISYKIQ